VPVAVQGQGAAEQIAAALRSVHRIPDVDVVIAGRGGGSLEDLWAFNEEIVARAIFECQIPVVSAVGHEVDVTIADLVADRRALTPSEAGELVVPHRDEIAAELNRLRQRLIQGLRSQAESARMQLDAVSSRRVFARPLERLHDAARGLDEIDLRLRRAIRLRLDGSRQHLAAVSGALGALSPLQVLERGYSVTRRVDNGEILRSAEQVQSGDEIETRLQSGRVVSRVERRGRDLEA
jgi:exodeoxyribonuclease VII large subunit